jgi:hypothetical protein
MNRPWSTCGASAKSRLALPRTEPGMLHCSVIQNPTTPGFPPDCPVEASSQGSQACSRVHLLSEPSKLLHEGSAPM